jgi:GNAT superfamily N-acetyltransferase
MEYRSATADDVGPVCRLLEAYMRETYHGPWAGTQDRLERDGFGAHFRVTVAVWEGVVVGFAAWRSTYDLHHCMPGLEVIDMYVQPSVRGRGIAACLLARLAADGAKLGARFMTGGAVESGSAARLYGRTTVSHGGQSYLSGRAFRVFAELAGVSPRQLARHLPLREWNLQA